MLGNGTPTSGSSLLPPSSGSMAVPTTSPQKLTSSGSATGNPRNKCALKPGHSLMDWIRLGNSGADLSGTKGRIVKVSSEELAKHNTTGDAWIAIRGKVYNVSRYMDFHPGGVEELMRGVGRDATKLFDEVHAWVNYEQLLSKCYIGPLRNIVKISPDIFSSLKPKAKEAFPPLPTEIVPRFDWIQKRNDLSLYFYTKSNANPGIIVQRKSSQELRLRIQVAQNMHQYDLELQQSVEWPPKICSINSETGKIELGLSKTQEALWTAYGEHKVQKLATWNLEAELDDSQYEFHVVKHEKFNHDSCELQLRAVHDVIMLLPVGYHVTIGALIKGEIVRRSFTPVPVKFLTKCQSSDKDFYLNFLVKCYEHGILTSYLNQLPIGAILQISAPKGNFKLLNLQRRQRVVFLCAGSGITPCLGLLVHVLECTSYKIEKMLFIYFNKTEADIWCYDQLQALAKSNERFVFTNVLSEPSKNWPGLSGRISRELLESLIERNSAEDTTHICICGPSGFNNAAESLLKNLNYKSNDIHIFQG